MDIPLCEKHTECSERNLPRSLDKSRIKNLLASKITRSCTIWLFFIRIHKNQVYNKIHTIPENMKKRIVHACNIIPSAMIDLASKSFISRAQKCLEVDG